MAGRTPGKHRIFYLNQCGWRQNAGNLVCFVPSTNQLRHPYLSVGVIGVTFAIPSIQGGTNAFHLINADDHLRLVQSAHQLVALLINIGCGFMCNLAGIAAQCDPLIESCGSKPDGTSLDAPCKHQPKSNVLPAVGAYSVWLFKRQILMPPLQEEWTDRHVLVGPIKQYAAHDFHARPQRSGIRRVPAGGMKCGNHVFTSSDQTDVDG